MTGEKMQGEFGWTGEIPTDAKERYNRLLLRISQRKKQVDELLKMLEKDTNWLTDPASTRFHMSQKFGLLIHSVNVTEILLKLRETLALKISEESCVIVGLFHDLGKIGMPGKPYYLPNTDDWEIKYRGKKYVVNNSLPTVSVAVRSLYILSKYVPLSDEEVQAIVYHDGLFVESGKEIMGKEEPLTLLLHWSDYWATRVIENKKVPFSSKDYFDRM